MADTVRIGIIGCGTIGKVHAKSIAKTGKCELVAAADIDKTALDALADEHGVRGRYTDYQGLLSDANVDAVIVGLPNHLHAPATIDALQAGKDVLCEKPIATTYEDAEKMAAAAHTTGKRLVIGVVNRYADSVNQIKRIIERGDLGDIYQVNIKFKAYRSIPGLGGWFTDKSKAGGGVMIDWGVHFVDLVLYVLNAPAVTAVSGQGASVLARNLRDYKYLDMWAGPPEYSGVYDVEECASGIIRTDGPFINFEGAWACNINERAMYIDFLGSKGGIRHDYGGGFTIYGQTEEFLSETKPVKKDSDIFANETRGFVESLLDGSPNRADIDLVLPSQKTLDMFYLSSREGREVEAEEL